MTIVDVGSEVKDWKDSGSGGGTGLEDISSLRSRLDHTALESSKSVLFIDSIMALASLGYSIPALASLVAELKSKFSSIVFVAHTDLSSSTSAIKVLESVATSIIDILPVPLSPMVDVTGSFSILQKRKNSKVSRSTEYFGLVKGSFDLIFYSEAQVIRKKDAPKGDDKLKSKMDQLTPEQEAARAAVALPFARARQTASQSVSGLPELSLDVPVEGAVYVDPEDIDPDGDTDLDDF